MLVLDKEIVVGVLLMLIIVMDKVVIRDNGGDLVFVYFIFILIIEVSL